MQLMQAIPQSQIVNDLPPEELAAVVLECLNAEAKGTTRDVPHFHIGNWCNGTSRKYEEARQPACNLALAAAWMNLVTTGMLALDPRGLNDWYVITARGRSIKSKGDYEHFKAAARFPRGVLHREIERVSYAEFLRGDYEMAVLKAFRALEIIVRRAIGAENDVLGKELMVRAFNPRDGALRDEDELTAEQEALMHLFMGAIGRFKNPPSHREVYFSDPAEAIEAVQFASLLMRIAVRREIDALGFTNLDEEEAP